MASTDTRSGSSGISGEILHYIDSVHAPQDLSLKQAFESPEKNAIPAIQVSPSEGKFISLLLTMIGAKKVVEIGTLVGYSTIHIARALPADGHLWTFEFNPKHAAVARANIKNAELESKVTLTEGPALQKLTSIEKEGPFDAVFIDADKPSYHHYGRWAAKNLRRGGLLLGDNSFCFGRLTDNDETATDLKILGNVMKATEVATVAAIMRRFHEETAKKFSSVCLPTPDGLLLGIKN